MARADLIVQLVQAGSRGKEAEFRKLVEELADEERQKQHHALADRLLRSVRSVISRGPRLVADPEAQGLFGERIPERTLDDLLLSDDVTRIVRELVEEQARTSLLRSHGLEPRHRVLLVGPPGTGKTSLAEALANELTLTLVVPRYEALIGSLLGETAERVGRLFKVVAERPCVLFLDELDVLAKERSDAQETGEIKRVVSSLLLQVDALPSHVVVVGATNHPDLLDRAVWRRFEVRLTLPMPDHAMRVRYFEQAQRASTVVWGYTPEALAGELRRLSFAELEAFTLDVRRRIVLEQPAQSARDIVTRRLSDWSGRATAAELG
jgi:SpoVK/Ycf46/Vps4 family AAA+-type ATPase